MCHKALKIIAAAVQDLIVSDSPIWLSGLEVDCLCSKVSKSLPCPQKAWSNELKPLMKGQLWSKVDLTFQTPSELGWLTLEHQLPNTIQDNSLDKHLFWKDDELIFETEVITYSGIDEELLFGDPSDYLPHIWDLFPPRYLYGNLLYVPSNHANLIGVAGRRAFPSTGQKKPEYWQPPEAVEF